MTRSNPKVGVIRLCLITLFLLVLPLVGDGAKILFFAGITNYSHRVAMWPLVEKLADVGHTVTFVSAHEPKSLFDPKVREILPEAYAEFYRKFVTSGGNLLEFRLQGDHRYVWETFAELGLESAEALAKDEEFLKWMEGERFDFVMVDSLASEVGMALAWKYGANFAIFCTTALYPWHFDAFGIFPETSWLPDLQNHYNENMDLVTRVLNTMNPIRWHFYRRWRYYPRLEKIMREGFKIRDLPDLELVEKNVSVVLLNTHYGEEYGRSLPPLVVPVAGMHCFQAKAETSKELQTFMDGSGPEGFIYVSFGSALKFSEMNEKFRNFFFNSMKRANTKFVVKWDGELMEEDLPGNGFYASWLPQQNILGHPNIKGFITHGGMLGIQEAVCNGVPLIIFAIFGEQDYNGNRHHNRGRGIKLEMKTLNQEILEDAISKLLIDPSFKKNMKRASELFLERPEGPLELAMWWTNYTLKHGLVPDLKPLGIYQTWYQRRLLDVWFVVYSVCLTVILIQIWLILILLRWVKSKWKRWVVQDVKIKET